MKWVTREKARVDRIACPWLITRFIDKDPTFLFVPAAQVMAVAEREGATPYDVPGVRLGHHGERCSFDAFLDEYKLQDPALQALAVIVRGADTDARTLPRVARALCGGHRVPGDGPGRLRQHGAPVPDVRRAVRLLPVPPAVGSDGPSRCGRRGAIFLPSFILMLSVIPVLNRVKQATWVRAFMRGLGPAVIGAIAVSLVAILPHAAPDPFALALLVATRHRDPPVAGQAAAVDGRGRCGRCRAPGAALWRCLLGQIAAEGSRCNPQRCRGLTTCAGNVGSRPGRAEAAPAEIKVPDNLPSNASTSRRMASRAGSR